MTACAATVLLAMRHGSGPVAPGAEAMSRTSFTALRVTRSWDHRVSAPPDRVFPLLCPVRERDWIPGWDAQLVHLPSGRAEDGGVFTTDFPGRGHGTWVIGHFEPPRAIGFVVYYSDRYVERLDVALATEGDGGTRVRWTRTYTGLNETGNLGVREVTGPELEARMQRQMRLLEYYCATGSMSSP